MSRQEYSFFDPATGLLTGKGFTGTEEALLLNMPEGNAAIPGRHDPLSRRVDLKTMEVIPYQPPSPGADYEWNSEMERWVLNDAAQQAADADAVARAQLDDIDRQSIRALREAAIGDTAALDKLRALEGAAIELRPDVITEDTNLVVDPNP
jgi:hypothetical protein